MGATLSEPITSKEISACENSMYRVASCAMQGWRVSMEDSHIHLLQSPSDEEAAFFAVYDGHGGARVAEYAGLHLHKRIIGNEHYENDDFHTAIKSGFLKLDEDLKLDEETKEQMSGTTAVTVLIKNNRIFCGNAGDSRAVLCQQGKAVPLSIDHKPNDPEELKRICAAGGWVDACRVNGNLALSRALGDFIFKNNDSLQAEEQIVTAFPDVVEIQITDEHEFIVLACDGIWDVLSSEQVVGFCRARLAEGISPEKVCEELVDRCLAPDCELSGVGCDNMSVVLVCLLQGLSKEEYIERLKRASLSPEAKNLPHLLQDLKVDQPFGHNANLFASPHDANDTSTFVGKEQAAEEAKSVDHFITPSESPRALDDSDNNDPPPVEFEVIPSGEKEK